MTEWLALAVSFLGVVIAGSSALLARSLSQRTQHGAAHAQINERYDRLMQSRADHPEVLAQGCRWTDSDFTRIYGQTQEGDRSLVLYYTHVELILGFCNAVEYAFRRGLLDAVA
jgi:hypothetical protein